MVRESEQALALKNIKEQVEDTPILVRSVSDRPSQRRIGRIITVRIQLGHLLKVTPIRVDGAKLVKIAARAGVDEPAKMFLGGLGSGCEAWECSRQSPIWNVLI